MAPHSDAGPAPPQHLAPRRSLNYWVAFAATVIVLFPLAFWAVYSPSQDHIGAIPLRGDGTWYTTMSETSRFRTTIFSFMGSARPLFAVDWRLFEQFEQKHHLKMFNMAFAGVPSGEFALRIIQKWGLKPKMWVIDLYAGSGEPSDLIDNSFFNTSLLSAFKSSGTAEVASYSRLRSYRNVLGRNIAWRLKLALGSLKLDSFRSAETGNWYLDNWPNSALDNNPNIKLTDDQFCPASPREIEYAKRYVEAIGGVVVLTQVPSKFSCARRVDGIASALAVAALTVDAEQFSSPDGGGHLDRASARKYSALFFSWLERLPEFRQLFPN